ncbi:MAG: peptidase S16 [Gammaproteobacteria bacterium]|jgi:hypothetical protein|nr:peptidase S16 [Gammaproteobacteria bacterium]|tara:strand:+ start:2744 stop:3343 length:600 start_codon:yes stop_codon:yes gene_type:complete
MAKIPLFPLPLVLLPGGTLDLQIFEARYLDLVKSTLQHDSGFGIIMIEEGEQVLLHKDQSLPAISHCGTYVKIIDFDQMPNGMLSIVVEGQGKFVIRDQYEEANRLMMADVEFLEMEEQIPIPEQYEHLAGLLDTLMQHEAVRKYAHEIDFSEAREVGSRLTELLPCPNRNKQHLLEIKDPVTRLKEISKLVERMGELK